MLCAAAAALASSSSGGPSYSRGLRLRARLDATPVARRTSAQYQATLNAFRAVYHADRAAPDAAASVEAVAELLAEEGRDLHNSSLLRSAVEQLDFLRRDFASSSFAAPALMTQGEIEDRDLHQPEAAAGYFAAFLRQYPASALAPQARAELRRLGRPAPQAPVRVAAAAQPARAPAEGAWMPDFPADQPAGAPPPAAPAKAAVPQPRGMRAGEAEQAQRSSRGMVEVTGIRQWSTASYTRIAIDLTGEVPYEASRVADPDRVFFDLHGARLSPTLAGRLVTVSDGGFLERIRAAQFSGDVVRVVLDVSDVSEYSAFWLPDPARLIIDIHGRPRGAPPIVYAQASPPRPSTAPAPVLERDVPPPHTVLARAAAAGMPTPRTAQPAAPGTFVANTAAPNGEARREQGSGDSVAAIAALSRQPGEVRATAAPTTAPVAAEVPASAAPPASARKSRRRVPAEPPAAAPETPGEMARAAAPDSDGGRSMVRALGLKINRIVIDAGHGGHDSGTLGPGGLEEKDVVLDVALRLGKLLREKLGADVIYTRDTDTFIPLETRTAIANKAQADLFISIHANSSPDPSARGVETYYLNFTSSPDALETAARENAVSDESIHQLSDLVKQIALQDKIQESREFASDVQNSLYRGLENGNAGLKDRGVKKAPFVVLIGANMPSILAEISFLTNPEDAVELREPAYRERIAESLYRGVARYVESLGSTRPPEVAAR